MAEEMLDGDLNEFWKLLSKTESSKEKEGSFKKEKTGEVQEEVH